MPLTTAEHELSHDDWTLLADGVPTFIAQIAGVAPVVVHVGSTEPSPGAPGLVLSDGDDRAIVLKDLTVEKFYGRAASAGETARLVVISG